MSSTGRGTERAENDRYMTPEKLARTCCHRLWFDGWLSPYANHDLLEPSAGEGSFVRAMREHFPQSSITANDIVDASEQWQSLGASHTRSDDFLSILRGEGLWDAVIGNPPYSEAESHVRGAIQLVQAFGGVVGQLLPLGFLESKARIPFWKEHPAACVYVLAERPSFTGKGTDSNAYGFFVWKRGGLPTPTRLEVVSWK